MALFATLARFLPGADSVAFPALLVDYHLCAECFIRDIDWIGAMTCRARISALFDLFRLVMTNLTLDRGGLKIVRMGSKQLLGIYLMVALDTFDPQILYVHLMVKCDLTY